MKAPKIHHDPLTEHVLRAAISYGTADVPDEDNDDTLDDSENEDGSPTKKIGFAEPEKPVEEDPENWVYDPLRWHPALGIKVLPPIPQVIGARMGTDGNMEVLQVWSAL